MHMSSTEHNLTQSDNLTTPPQSDAVWDPMQVLVGSRRRNLGAQGEQLEGPGMRLAATVMYTYGKYSCLIQTHIWPYAILCMDV